MLNQEKAYREQFSKLKALHLNLNSPMLDNCDYTVTLLEEVIATRKCKFQMEEGAQLHKTFEKEDFLNALSDIAIDTWLLDYQAPPLEREGNFRWSLVLDYEEELPSLVYVGIDRVPKDFEALLTLLDLEQWKGIIAL